MTMVASFKAAGDSMRWQLVVGTAGAVVLGLVLLVAAWGKALDPEAFVEQIRIEGLDLFGLARPVAFAALALEFGLGLALVLGLRRLWILVPSALLVLFFLLLTGRAYWQIEQGLIDETASCGCFGSLVTRTPAEAFWQDLALLGLPAILMFLGRRAPQRPARRRAGAVVLATLGGLVFAWKAPALPLDDLATPLRPGVEVARLCAGAEHDPTRICLDALVSELDQGLHWVVISGLEEESFLEAVERLNEMALADGDTRLWVVTAAAPEVVGSFQWTQAPAFEIREAPPALLRPLYRSLPRSFLVEDGRVEATFSGLPPGGGPGELL
ncbi:MAG: MauE/DoxX family redox-associated membrane protein [Thermoanaerobaculia bacterium]